MRKMKKFAEGGRASRGQARYDRMMKDIESDYAKKKDRPGRAGEVAKAKYEQRMADAKDDLAKARGEDRSQTRAAEKASERNLSMTRKYGAVKSAVKADDVAKVSSTDDVLKSVPKPQIVANATAKAPAKTPAKAPAKPAAKSTRMGDQGFAYKSKTEGGRPAMAAIRDSAAKAVAQREAQKNWRNVRGGSNSGADKASGSSAGARDNTAAGRRERMGKALSYLNPFSYLENKASRLDPSKMASGGAVKKKPTPPKPMPPQPTPEEIRKRDEQNRSIKKAKPTPADAAAIGRGNRSSGYKKGGMVMKKAAKFGNALVKKSDDTKGRAMMKKAGGGKCYAKGGSVSSRADGCATKGKTKGKMV